MNCKVYLIDDAKQDIIELYLSRIVLYAKFTNLTFIFIRFLNGRRGILNVIGKKAITRIKFYNREKD